MFLFQNCISLPGSRDKAYFTVRVLLSRVNLIINVMAVHWSRLRCHTQRRSKYGTALGIVMMALAPAPALQTAVQYVPHTCSYGNVVKLSD